MHDNLKLDIVVSLNQIWVTFSENQFLQWVQAILADEELVAKLVEARNGRTHWLDLDEGDAGIFESRVSALTSAIKSKLDSLSDVEPETVGSLLFREVWEAVQKRFG